MKQCTKCKEWKVETEFSRDKNRKDGLYPHCKECVRVYQKKWIQRESSKKIVRKAKKKYRSSEHGKKKEKEYAKTEKYRAIHLKWMRKWRSTEEGKRMTILYTRRWEKKNPIKKQAHLAVMTAVKRGKIPHVSTNPCNECSEEAAVYHHWSYERKHWLDVIPYCRKCHVAVHKEMTQ